MTENQTFNAMPIYEADRRSDVAGAMQLLDRNFPGATLTRKATYLVYSDPGEGRNKYIVLLEHDGGKRGGYSHFNAVTGRIGHTKIWRTPRDDRAEYQRKKMSRSKEPYVVFTAETFEATAKWECDECGALYGDEDDAENCCVIECAHRNSHMTGFTGDGVKNAAKRGSSIEFVCNECGADGNGKLGRIDWFHPDKKLSLKQTAETFEAPYGGTDAIMGIAKDTPLEDFTDDELTTSSAIHGDFDKASIDYSGHQNIQVRAESFSEAGLELRNAGRCGCHQDDVWEVVNVESPVFLCGTCGYAGNKKEDGHFGAESFNAEDEECEYCDSEGNVRYGPKGEYIEPCANCFGAETEQIGGFKSGDMDVMIHLTGLNSTPVGFNEYGEELRRLDEGSQKELMNRMMKRAKQSRSKRGKEEAEQKIKIIKNNDFTFTASYGFSAEEFGAEQKLKRKSCCCGATKSHPCACMIKGVMKCSATCPCSLEKKGAESEDSICPSCKERVGSYSEFCMDCDDCLNCCGCGYCDKCESKIVADKIKDGACPNCDKAFDSELYLSAEGMDFTEAAKTGFGIGAGLTLWSLTLGATAVLLGGAIAMFFDNKE